MIPNTPSSVETCGSPAVASPTAEQPFPAPGNIARTMQILRFLISGGAATATNVALLYLFAGVLKWWYLSSAILSYTLSFSVSFTLQKFWTFRDGRLRNLHQQAALCLAVSLSGLVLNTGLMYALVSLLHVWYLLAQILASGLIACGTYIVYKHRVFLPR